MAANTDVQIDVVFAPKTQEGGGAFKTAVMNVTGPGPHGNWALPVPLRGSMSPVNVGPLPPQPSSKPINPNVFLSSGKPGNAPGAAPPTAPAANSSGMPGRLPSGRPALFVTARNSKLSKTGIDLKIMSLLSQQNQVAVQERNAMLAQPKTISGNKPMSSTGNTGPAATAMAPTRGGKAGDNTMQGAAAMSAPVSDPFACAKAAPAPLLFSVNGQKSGVVFTTDPDNNVFTFKGCNFGDVQGSLHLFGGFTQGKVPFEIQFWNDTSIVARVQPDLKKELDHDSVNLVVTLGSGHQHQFSGYKFYAARQAYTLASIPNPSSKIIFGQPNPANCQHAKNITFMACGVYSPAENFTVGVVRSGVDGTTGTDQYTISGLLPGFEVSDVSLLVSPDVPKNGWSLYSLAENISVTYVFDFKNADASYWLQISAAGPRGFGSPWK